ncbi:hypothetical protein D1007_32421 [Hordeum vulgare]|nr:hypothetical protein D1007_32421 [Hordeum vulgare]
MSGAHQDLARFMALGRDGDPHGSPSYPCPSVWCTVAVLEHYQIYALHLDPCSLVLLSAFAFLCEAFVGVTPSVELLPHFFSLELVSEEQCSGCVSLKMVDASVPGALDAELLPEAKGFRRQWVHTKIAEARALFQPPPTPATPKLGRKREERNDRQLTPVLIWLEKLKRAGVTMVMVVREFIHRRVAPLQCHSRPMCAYAGTLDPMKIQVLPLSPDVLHELLRRLTGGDPNELPQNGLPLYNFKDAEALITGMPLFDEWGFLPGGDARPWGASTLGVQVHENSGRAAPPTAEVGGVSPPTPWLLLWDGPGLVVTTGQRWKSLPLLSSFNRCPPGLLVGPAALAGRGGRLRAASPRRGGLR